MKKAQLEVSFNWIFIILAGAAILFFFMNVINTQTDQGRETISRTITVRMDSIFSALESSPGSVQINDRLNFEMQFACRDDGHSYTVNNGNARNYLQSQILFSPHEIGNSRLITWTLRHEAPYPIANLLMVSDEQTAYVFIGEDLQILYDEMPEEFIKFNYSQSEIYNIQDKGHRRYIIVAKNSISLNYIGIPSRKRSTVKFTDLNSGQIIFEGEGAVLPFFGREMLFAAIVTGDKDLFRCSFEKLKEKSEIMHEIIYERAKKIRQKNLSQACDSLYQDEFINPINDTLKEEDPFHVDTISQISQLNTRLIRASCPTLY
ncbi:MAG: hypothetical protein ACMXX7_01200 [Candidatus Woesearchaeota archaeon]